MANLIGSFASNIGTAIKDVGSGYSAIGSLFDQARRDHIAGMDNQLLCQFQVIIVPHVNVIKNLVIDPGSIINLLTIAENTNIGRFFVYTITVPSPVFEYTRVGNKQYVTDIIPPEEVTITFMENEKSTVQRYLSHWQDEVSSTNGLDILGMVQGATSMVKGLLGSVDADSTFQYKFKSDPGLAKKTMYLIPLDRKDNPAFVWYALEGLSIKSVGETEFSQESGEPMKIAASFAVDNVRMMKPL